MSTDAPVIDDNALPGLFRSADTASKDAQQHYMRLVACDLLFLVAGSVLSAWAASTTAGKELIALGGLGCLMASTALTWAIRNQKQEKEWYGGRAIAESVKTRSWHYMTRAKPFDHAVEVQAEDAFVQNLQEILKQKSHLGASLQSVGSADAPITAKMRAVRQLELNGRKQVYLKQRINDQQDWYARKAKANKTARGRWFNAVIALQVLAVSAAIYALKYPESPLSLAATFAAGASACLAWLQVKQHQELAQSYNIAAHELSFIAHRLDTVSDEVSFSQFVDNAEDAISREHTLWVARRDTGPEG